MCLAALELSVGGLERLVIDLAAGIGAHGVPVRIVLIENDDNAMIGDVPPDVDLHCLPRWLPGRLLALRRLTRGHVTHLHFWGGHVRPLYRLVLLGRPVVVTYHCTYRRSRWWHGVDRLLSRLAVAVVACSRSVAAWCQGVVRIAPSRIQVIHNASRALDLEPAGPAAKATPHPLEVLSVCRLVEQKDPATLVRGFGQAVRAGLDAHLTVVGVGPLMEPLLRLAHEVGVHRRVTWLGELWDQRAIRRLMRECDLLVSASRYEGFSLSVLEAAFERLPALLSDIDAHRECMEGCAAYFPVEDSAALAAELLALASDVARRERLAVAAADRVQRLFSMDACVLRHLELYTRALV